MQLWAPTTLNGLGNWLSKSEGAKRKTINSKIRWGVTYLTTNLPAHGLSAAGRTGSPDFHVLWSIAICIRTKILYSSKMSAMGICGGTNFGEFAQ
jgi:hypothetical protein